MTMAFQEAYLLLQKQYQARELTAVQLQERQGELEKQRQEIQAYEEKAQKDLEAKRGDLLKPILAKIDDAIKAVAKENGILMIFDISTGSMLYAAETIACWPLPPLPFAWTGRPRRCVLIWETVSRWCYARMRFLVRTIFFCMALGCNSKETAWTQLWP